MVYRFVGIPNSISVQYTRLSRARAEFDSPFGRTFLGNNFLRISHLSRAHYSDEGSQPADFWSCQDGWHLCFKQMLADWFARSRCHGYLLWYNFDVSAIALRHTFCLSRRGGVRNLCADNALLVSFTGSFKFHTIIFFALQWYLLLTSVFRGWMRVDLGRLFIP